MRVIRSLCIAFSTYSRIPVPQVAWTDENRKYSMCFFPLIGAVIGLLLWGWPALCDALGFGALLRGAVGALLPILVTGGIHMDGFMDTSDALASWQSPEKRLEILKDSRVGAGGVTAFVFLVLLKVAFLSQLTPDTALPALIGIPAAARFGTLISIFQFPYARQQGLGKAFVTYAPAHTVAKAFVLALVPAFLCGPFYLGLLGAAMLLSLWANFHISHKLGGVTGDTYGAVLEGSEMALLLVTAVGSRLADFLL